MKITEQVWAFAEPVVQAHGCSLWDVEYVKEGGDWFLRLYIDKEGGVDINDCRGHLPRCGSDPRREGSHSRQLQLRGLLRRTRAGAEAPVRFRTVSRAAPSRSSSISP